MPTLLENAWTALPYGYGVQEAIYNKKPGNKIGIERMEGKPMEWFEPLRDGKLKMNKPGNALSEEVDTVRKFCLTRRRPTYKNPYGEALLSRLFWPWQFRHTGWEHWMKFLERFGDPLLLAKANDPKAMLEVMQQAGFYTAVAGFTSDDIKAVTPGAGDGFEKADQILQKRIQRVILGQNLTSEVKGGSLAATQAHMEVKEDKRQADIRLVKPAAQWLINSLWHLNGFEGEPPLIVFEDETGLELERSERDSNLKSSGVVKGFTSQYLLRVYDFEDGDFLLDDGTDDDDKGKVTGLSVKLSADQGFTKDQQAVEDGVAEILDGIPDPIPVDLIRSAVLAAKSPADLEDRLAALLDAKDPEFTELLARASFAAEILGYVQERENG